MNSGMRNAVDICEGRRNMRAARCELFAVVLLLFSVASFAATPGLDTLVGFDTAWTLVYDGGKYKNDRATSDKFNDIKSLPDGSIVCTGLSGDSTSSNDQMILIKIDKSGNILWKKLYPRELGQYAYSVAIARNGDFLVGGGVLALPLLYVRIA